MGTKNNPGSYDCYANAEPDEPMFVLLARDQSAPDIVRMWAQYRSLLIRCGLKPESDWPMIHEARDVANQMATWHDANRKPKGD